MIQAIKQSKTSLRELATGQRLQRWIKDESRIAGEQVEIEFNSGDDFSIYCPSELGMYRVAEKWRKSPKLEYIGLFFSENLSKWVVSVEFKE